ncbi:MAG: ABC transporter permease subunit [Candidatus Kaiserbacteria bacterium]|nr:ABC transporter permease subunit [Candidatus Kaiserbacteria bacterium]
MKHVHHHPRHIALTYPASVRQHFYLLLIGPLVLALVVYLIASAYQLPHTPAPLSPAQLLSATLATIVRIAVAYVASVLIAVPLAIFATKTKTLERIFLPVFDILGSVPILAFFPVVVLVFVRFDFPEGAAVFILFLNILWNIVFTVVGGLKIIPKDIVYAAKIFGLTGWSYTRRLILPAIFPQLVVGSILAVAEGWNLVIVAEALHTYIPHGDPSQDLFGIGSILVQAAANSQNGVFIAALIIMVLFIGVFNLLVWQRLLTISQRFRFD